ncbi:unnamed protein product [Brassicogethes aeneus]|uniref:receptor protein-tyrosine kinase n=1 Tax=Brassicogethes aeneus TaxID=1431903 RepID=A0A9P0ASD8_BRAAE|nr:unnamed protein product [Brassicogethes aeneus]
MFSTTVTTGDEDDEDYNEDYDEDFSNLNSTSANGTLIFVKELTNITRDPGKLLKLTCEVQTLDLNNTNKITIKWRQNEAPIEIKNRIKVNNTISQKGNIFKSVLKIKKLEYFDQGYFECIVTQGNNKIKSQGYIKVNPELSTWGTSDMSSFKTDQSIGQNSLQGEITTFIPNLISKNTENAEFVPTISKPNTFSPPIEFDLPSNTPKFNSNPTLYNGSEPFCQQYKGKTCQYYLEDQYVYIEPPYTQSEIEENIHKAFITIKQSNDITSGCNKFAFPSMCYSAFPICNNPGEINKYQSSRMTELRAITKDKKEKFKKYRGILSKHLRRICRDDCFLLENDLCSKEYAIAKRHPILKDKCYWDTGSSYRGIQDTSINNNKCLRWAHQFQIPTSKYPELTGHNYCRNPGDVELEPFCYVEQDRKEPCGINKCVYIFGMYVVAIILAIIFFICVIVTYCYCRRKNKSTRNLQNKALPQVTKNIYGNAGPSSPIELNTLLPKNMPPQRNHSNKNGLRTVPQYTYKEVRFLEELGEGAFGKVYKGELKTKNIKSYVAVKSLKENASAKTQADFQREIELISELKHPNIICLLGVVVKQEPMCMLFEFMSEGDLHEYLIANSPSEGRCLTHDQFLHIAIQIAQGESFRKPLVWNICLRNHYVHRDLAARNCLVSKDLIVKISDFGLSRDMYSCDYYRVQSKSLLPVRWMPPESILYGKFTTESDVWSYGVVLWEIYSYGVQPYYGYNNQEVINLIRSRKLLPCPTHAPSYCYALMVECWQNRAYFRTPSNHPTPLKIGLSSKSSHTSDSQTLCPTSENHVSNFTWERENRNAKPSSSRLHDSQNSLTSRNSSLGNTTQSTTVSLEHRKDKRPKRNVDSMRG